MRHKLSVTLFAALAFSGTLSPLAAASPLEVVATVPDLAAITREIGGSRVQVTSLALHTQDPHFVDAKPNLIVKLNRAALLVAVGLELEDGWLPTLQTGARNTAIQIGGAGYLSCGNVVDVLEGARGAVDRREGDIHPSGNPHYLNDPRQALKCARAVADKLAAIDPGHAAEYGKNYEAFRSRLEARIASWQNRLAPYRGASIITYHRSFSYLNAWLDLHAVAELEPKPGIQPTPRHVISVIQAARAQKVRAILQESYYPSQTGRLVAGKIGARLAVLPAAANEGAGQTYVAHMEEIISALEQALRG